MTIFVMYHTSHSPIFRFPFQKKIFLGGGIQFIEWQVDLLDFAPHFEIITLYNLYMKRLVVHVGGLFSFQSYMYVHMMYPYMLGLCIVLYILSL